MVLVQADAVALIVAAVTVAVLIVAPFAYVMRFERSLGSIATVIVFWVTPGSCAVMLYRQAHSDRYEVVMTTLLGQLFAYGMVGSAVCALLTVLYRGFKKKRYETKAVSVAMR